MRAVPLNQKGCLTRNCGLVFFVIVIVVFFGLFTGNHAYSLHSTLANALSRANAKHASPVEHPIARLMKDAELKYRAKLKRQSTTLEAAVKEYKRRYGMDPPKGFDDWWKFTRKYSGVMVDEYDGLMADLEPFRRLSGVELRRRVAQVGQLPSIDIVRVEDGQPLLMKLQAGFDDSEAGARAGGLRDMLGKFVHKLPNMDFPVNAIAEGRVLVPWEHRKYPSMTKEDSSEGVEAMLGGPFSPDWGESGTIWEAWRRTCDPESSARRLYSSLRDPFASKQGGYLDASKSSPEGDYTFTNGTSADLDFCAEPHAHYGQGHFFSDWRTIPVLYPVFSPAKAQGFMDIRIPSHYYYGSTKRYTYGWDAVNLKLKDVDAMEVPWEKKLDRLFWRGATTGGGNHPMGFAPQYHRHRFLRLSSDKSNTSFPVTFPNPSAPESLKTVSVPIGELNEEIMDAAFVKAVAVDGYPGGMKALRGAHRFGGAVPLGRHWSYKYLLDFDGMSYSGRFLAFLASDCVPVKATVYKEFFSDWIEPWVHFIPLSTSYKEIYNLYAYFSGPTTSMLRAANISMPESTDPGVSEAADPNTTSSAENNQSDGSLDSTDIWVNPRPWSRGEGDRRLWRIARAGRQWKRTIGRTLDMEIYVYRLALEWARLWADDREATSFVL